ncbi:MAG: lycopene cyclase domain-containing protein [Parcubacteria group bacterium]
MLSSKFAYLLGDLYFLAIWLYFFWKWPNRRKPLWVVGTLAIIVGVCAEYFWWTSDWWYPKTITGTRIGIEDILLSFTLPGISALVYKFFFNKDLDRKFELNKKTFFAAMRRLTPMVLISFGAAAVLFYFFHVASFISTPVGMLIAGLYILYFRNDLAAPVLWSALLVALISLPVYIFWQIAVPGFIDDFWNISRLSNFRIFGAPVEDIIWFAMAGFVMGGLVEYAFDHRLVDAKDA